MTTEEFNKIGIQLTGELSPSVMNRRLLCMEPLGYVLRGLSFDPSAFSKSAFYVTAFAMPLFIPTDHIAYLVGDRLRIGNVRDGWDNKSESTIQDLKKATIDQAKPFLYRVSTLSGFLHELTGEPYNPHKALTKAFGLILLEQPQEGIFEIHSLLPKLDQTSHWQREISEQAHLILHLLERGFEHAKRQLEDWRLETITNLKLNIARV